MASFDLSIDQASVRADPAASGVEADWRAAIAQLSATNSAPARLQRDVEQIRSSINDLRARVAELQGRIGAARSAAGALTSELVGARYGASSADVGVATAARSRVSELMNQLQGGDLVAAGEPLSIEQLRSAESTLLQELSRLNSLLAQLHNVRA